MQICNGCSVAVVFGCMGTRVHVRLGYVGVCERVYICACACVECGDLNIVQHFRQRASQLFIG